MPIDISKLVQTLESKEVLVRGQAITLRAISASRMVQIDAALPAPVPPDAGEEKHPAFRAMRQRHFARRCALIIGVSADIAGPDGNSIDLQRDPKQVEAYCDHILSVLTEQEVMRLYRVVGDIGDTLSSPDAGRIGSETNPGN